MVVKRVKVCKVAYGQDYYIEADGIFIGVVYFEPDTSKPVVQVWKSEIKRIEVKDTPVSKNAFTVENMGGS